MNKHYCMNCGVGTPFDFEKPKFCSGCGQPFAGVTPPSKAQARQEPPARRKARFDVQVSSDQDEEISEVPHIDPNDFIEVTDLGPRVFKSDEIVGSSSSKRSPRSHKGAKIDKKKVVEQFSKRAASQTKRIEVK